MHQNIYQKKGEIYNQNINLHRDTMYVCITSFQIIDFIY